MDLESIGSGGVSPFGFVSKLLDFAGKVGDEGSNIADLLKKSQLGEWMSKTGIGKSLRIAATLLAMYSNAQFSNPAEALQREKNMSVVATMIWEGQKSRSKTLRAINSLPGKEQHQMILRKIEDATKRIRTKLGSNETDIAALNLVMSNILEPNTSAIVQEIFPLGVEDRKYREWMGRLDVAIDFKALYESPLMNDPGKRKVLIDTIHRIYQEDEVKGMQELVGDSRLLFYYEVAFRAINQDGYENEHTELVKEAAEFLLKEGNVEGVISILRASKADVPVEKLVGLLAEYVPDSQFAHKQGHKVPLEG